MGWMKSCAEPTMALIYTALTSKLATYGRRPHLLLRLTLVSSIDLSWACMKRSKFLFTCTKADAKLMLRNEPVSCADITCWLNRTNTYMQ